MSFKSYHINNGSWFGTDYSLSDVEKIDVTVWDDCVGEHFVTESNKVLKRFDEAHAELWDNIEPLLDVKEDDIQYESRDFEIRDLRIEDEG